MHFRHLVRVFAHIQLLPVLENGEETTLIGGQAVMEGVMMRSPNSYCVAVRKPDGEISVQEEPLPRLTDRHPILKWPVIRGLATLGGAMWLGMKALKFSADCALGKFPEEKAQEKASAPAAMVMQICFSLLFMIALYKFVPLYLATQLGKHFEPVNSRFAINLVDGLLRIGIFLSFMLLLSLMKDMRRLFQYHGAEHRVVFNFESGQEVSVKNAQQFVTWHPRCGTSFLFVVLIVAMVIYAFLPIDSFALKLVARIALFPAIAGLSYEIIRFAARKRSGLLAILTRPGLWLQRVTTKSPSDDQTEVAICALNHAMVLEKAQGGQLVIA